MTDPFVGGGDAAGMSAASKVKRDAPDGEVVVLERSDWISYGACGLPYYVRGEIADLKDLVVLEPRAVIEERGIDLRRHHEAVVIDREGHDGAGGRLARLRLRAAVRLGVGSRARRGEGAR